jgi:nicotinamide mononucleotide transporter
VNGIEIIAVGLGLANIVLIVGRSIWNYPVGIVMVLLYARIFFDAKLYSDALLQFFFLVVNLYGWWAWLAARDEEGAIRVRRMDNRARFVWIAATALAAAGWGTLMARFTDASLPYWDAAIAAMSIAAQILLARRFLENWVLWIAVNILSVGVYSVKELHLTAGLYLVFLALAFWGLQSWARAERGR